MNDTLIFIECSLILFFATAFRTTFGFGEALIAVPLLSLLLPVKESAPVAVLASIVIAVCAVMRHWKHIHFSSAGRLLLATILGIPLGLVVLSRAPEAMIKATLGIFLLVFAALSLRKSGFFTLKDDRYIWLFGFLAGVTGGSYGMNGPPLAIYGAGRGWPADRFRATLQAYFLPASVLGMVGYYLSRLWTSQVNLIFVESLPAIGLGILAGNRLGEMIGDRRFVRLLYKALILVALILIFQACRAES